MVFLHSRIVFGEPMMYFDTLRREPRMTLAMFIKKKTEISKNISKKWLLFLQKSNMILLYT